VGRLEPEWGWRIHCRHPGCERKVEHWGLSGVPALFPSGLYDSGPMAGWFFRRPKGRRPTVIAYCKAHNGPAIEWMQKHREWTQARTHAGRAMRVSLIDVAIRAFCPEILWDRSQEAIHTWEDSHPPPKPPWSY